MIENHPVVSQEEWIEARKQHLAREKEFTRLRDQLSAERRALPWIRVGKDYVFEGPDGEATLADLFDGRSQLIVYHFMPGPDWEEGCKSCSFWADNLQGIDVHLAARDVTLLTVSSAPLERIEKFKRRMGWTHEWVSCAGSDFNHDYQVTFTPEELERGEVYYNYAWSQSSMTERPGISVFYKAADGTIYHTCSCYSRGLDMLNGAYHYLDLAPKGRDEAGLAHNMAWVRLHDSYGV
jgi:predicted dithiol-disulfide oxidoreductase (DUF899 family)